MVMEHGEPSMKQWLLGSRALDHQPQYAARHGRVATARYPTNSGLGAVLENRPLPLISVDFCTPFNFNIVHFQSYVDFQGGIVA